MRRASAGAKLLMRFASKIIDKYNALPEEERDINSILGHSIRMQVPHERARLADLVSTSFPSRDPYPHRYFTISLPNKNLLMLYLHIPISFDNSWSRIDRK